MRKFGLAAILTFIDKGATAAMGRVGRRAALLRKQFAGVGAGLTQMRAGLGAATTAALPVSAAFGLMLKKGADFEQAVANLRSVTLDTANRTTPALASMAKTLGATTVFSATQAADAMTNLARAGLQPVQIMGAIEGTLNAAAAEGIDLATAADMVASNIKAFGLEATDANKIAGTLALTSARFNTNMIALQEGLKLAAPAAKLVNASLADTSAVIGALSDIGLKGTLAGTALRASLTKIIAPSKEGRKAMARLGLSMGDVRKQLDKGNIVGMFRDVIARMKGIKSPTDRAAIAVKLFGLRGVAITKALDLSGDSLKRFNKNLADLRKESGTTAEQMARIQLRTLTGQAKLLYSAFESVSIAFSESFSGESAGLVESMAKRLGQLALAMRVVSGEKIVGEKAQAQVRAIPATVFEVARGIKDAFGEIKAMFASVGESLGWLGRTLGLTGDGGARSVAKIATKVAILTAAFAPLALVLGGVTRLFGGLAKAAIGATRVAVGTLGGLLKGASGFLGKLGKAGKVADLAAAQPVRVVNFHEAGLGGLGAGLPGTSGARELDLAGRGAAGTLTRWRAGLAASVGRLGRFGTFLNSNVLSLSQHTSTLGKVGGALGKAGLLGAALGAGYALGTLIDRATGASKKIADAAFNFTQRIQGAQAPLKEQVATARETLRATESLTRLVELSKKGIGIRERVGGPRQRITRELVEAKYLAMLKRQELSQKQVAEVMRRLAPLFAKLPPTGAPGAGTKPVKPAKDALVSTAGLLPVSAGDVVLDRASLASAVVSQLRGGMAGRAGGGLLGGGDPGRTTPPQARASTSLRIEVPVEIDGRQIARAVAEVQLDELERSGASLRPGARRALLERGFLGGSE